MKIAMALLICLSTSFCHAEFVGIDNNDFMPHYTPQQESMWCWASSAEMVLSYEGIDLPQQAIVTKAKGFMVNQGGSPSDIIRSVNGVFQDRNDNTVVISGQYIMGAPLPTVLYNQLKAKKPVILTYQANAYSGHAVVVTGIEATIEGNSVRVTSIHIFDPFCYRQTMVPAVVSGPFGPQTMLQPTFQKDDSLITQELPIVSWGNQVVLPGHGMITGMILVDGSTD